MRALIVFASALALMAVALLAALVAPLGPGNTLQLVEAAARAYSYPLEYGGREYLEPREDLLAVGVYKDIWPYGTPITEVLGWVPGIDVDAPLRVERHREEDTMRYMVLGVDHIGEALAHLRSSDKVYSVNLVFEPMERSTPTENLSYLEPMAAAARIYSAAKRRRDLPLSAPILELDSTLADLAEEADRVAPGPVMEDGYPEAMILTDTFTLTVNSKEHVGEVVDTLLAWGGQVLDKSFSRRGEGLYCSVGPEARARCITSFDLIRLAEETGHIVGAQPRWEMIDKRVYRLATGSENLEQQAERQRPAMSLEELHEDMRARKYPDELPETPYYYHLRENQTVSVWLEGKRIALWFEEDFDENEIASVISSFPEFSADQHEFTKSTKKYVLVETETDLADEAIQTLSQRLADDRRIRHVSPVFLNGKGSPLLFTNPIIVYFPVRKSRRFFTFEPPYLESVDAF